MDGDTNFVPSSPTNSCLSSSDLDTESTGSFFHDRSTTLGTLMGVSFPEIAVGPARVLSWRDHVIDGGGRGGEGGGRRPNQSVAPERRRQRRHRGGRRWWRLCRDNMVGPTSLGEFLQVERRLDGSGEVADGRFLYGGGGGAAEHEALGGGPLFEDGRVLPPLPPADGRRRQQQQQQRATDGAVSLGRLPVLLTGICSGGEGKAWMLMLCTGIVFILKPRTLKDREHVL